MTDITTTDVEITCSPGDGILTVSADTVAAIDRLAGTLPNFDVGGPAWHIEVRLPFAVLTARPAHRQENHA